MVSEHRSRSSLNNPRLDYIILCTVYMLCRGVHCALHLVCIWNNVNYGSPTPCVQCDQGTFHEAEITLAIMRVVLLQRVSHDK